MVKDNNNIVRRIPSESTGDADQVSTESGRYNKCLLLCKTNEFATKQASTGRCIVQLEIGSVFIVATGWHEVQGCRSSLHSKGSQSFMESHANLFLKYIKTTISYILFVSDVLCDIHEQQL